MIEVMVNGRWFVVRQSCGVYKRMVYLEAGNGFYSGFNDVSEIQGWKLNGEISNYATCKQLLEFIW
jgi:hypothetical protein